jgi:glycosyltransferase involved in cell wall biosynthesis
MRGGFHYGVHRLTRDFIFKRASGFVAVSYEIAAHSSNTKYGKPIKVSGNAIDLGQYESLPAPEHDVPRLAYIGAPDTPWHGIDKLFWLAEACPDFAFDLIGSGPEAFKEQSIPPNIHLHGFVERSVYQHILAQADVGIGSLALHRINVNEIPPLKVREYLAYGIPVLLAYEDTDLLGTDFDFVLKIANMEDNLRENLDAIRQFVFRMQGKRVDRQLIAPLIDSRVKEQQRLAFMVQIAAGGKQT